MLEQTEQRLAGAAIGLAGVIIGSLVVGIVLHKAGLGRVGPKTGGPRDTPIVMEGGSIVFDSETAWTCTPDQSSQVTTCTTTLKSILGQPTWVQRIKIVPLDEQTAKLIVKKIKYSDTWAVTLFTAANAPEAEVFSGLGSVITVTTSARAQTVLSDGATELTIFPYGAGSYVNKVSMIDISVNSVSQTQNNPVSCSSGTEDFRCFVHLKIKDQ